VEKRTQRQNKALHLLFGMLADELNDSGLDMKKVEDYAKDEIARMSQEHFNKEILAWCEVHYRTLFDAMTEDPEYTKKVLAIERDGEKPRKDVAKWSDAPEQFGYFYDDIF
jgi:glutamyl-tRNA synthetase